MPLAAVRGRRYRDNTPGMAKGIYSMTSPPARDRGAGSDLEADFRTYVEQHGKDLARLAWMLSGDWAGAEVLVHRALESSWRRWPETGPATRTFDFALRSLMSAHSRRCRPKVDVGWHTQVVDTVDRNDFAVDVRLRHAMIAALTDLPSRQRAALVLRYCVDLSEVETAAAMTCSVRAVRRHTARGLRALRGVQELVRLHGDAR